MAPSRPGRPGRGAVLAGSLLLHVVVLAMLAWPVAVRFPDRSDDEDAMAVTLERRAPPPRTPPGRFDPTTPSPRRSAAAPLPAAVEPLLLAAGQAGGPAPAAAADPGARFDLGAALRAGGFACAGALNTRLTPEERARCQERLGAQALKAPALPAPIDPAKRAHYDAVVEAYSDRRRVMVPLNARGANGMSAVDDSVHNGHGPRVGCSVKFGPNAGKAPKGPANALRAGPCFIQPPVGSLTPEADIRKPY